VIRAAFGIDDGTVLNRIYREQARHFGFVVDPTPPRRPEKNGKVESAVRYIKQNLFKAHAPQDIEEARIGLQRWIEEIANQRKHGTTARRPAEHFAAEEKALLQVLPLERFDLLEWKTATVHRDSHVVFDKALYSVPWPLIGQEVELRVTARTVQVYHADEPIWLHDRVASGRRSTVESHLPDRRAPLRHRSRVYWEEKAVQLGAPVAELVQRIFDADDVLSQLRRVQQIVSLLQQYPTHRACAASQRALHYGNLSYCCVKDILLRGLDLQPIEEKSKLLRGHWSSKPRFSRAPTKKTDDPTP
jgi:hypothetical protein